MKQLMYGDSRTVLIAVDGSQASDTAVEWALSNYLKDCDSLKLIHVTKTLDESSKRNLSASRIEKIEAETIKATHEIITKYLRMCSKAKINCGWKISVGDPKQEICKEVFRTCADVLILGDRATKGSKMSMAGLTSEHCVNNCACPVILVKAREPSHPCGQFKTMAIY